MTLREILTRAMEIVGTVDLTTNNEEKTRLVACGNFILSECADRYSDMRAKEDVTVEDGTILFSSLNKPIKKVLSIKKNGFDVPYTLFNSYCTVEETGTVTIEYAYYFTRKELDQTLDLPTCFGIDTLAIGTAAEYFFRNGFSDEAILYKNRYDYAVKNDLRTIKAGKTKARRFL